MTTCMLAKKAKTDFSPLCETFTVKQEWKCDDSDSIFSSMYSRLAAEHCLQRSFRVWRLISTAKAFLFTLSHYTGRSVQEEKGRRWCQAIHHTVHAQGPLYGD